MTKDGTNGTCTLKIKPAASLMFSNTPLKGAAFGASLEAPELFREKDMETRSYPWDFRTFRSYGLLDFQKNMEDRGRKK